MAGALADRGAAVSVLTQPPQFYEAIDPGLAATSRPDIRVLHTRPWELTAPLRSPPPTLRSEDPARVPTERGSGVGRMLIRLNRLLYRKGLVPDDAVAWIPPALAAALELHARQPIEHVIASAPPYSVLRLGQRIAERTGATLTVDYRDPWLAERQLGHRSGWRRAIEDRMERQILARTDLALFTSASAERLYRDHFPELRRSRVLYNGFEPLTPSAGSPSGQPLTWMHAGSTYSGIRSLEPVVRAIERIRDEVPVRFVLIGPEPRRELELARSLGLDEQVSWLGRLELHATLRTLQSAHRLVAVVADVHPHSIPAKVFDYLSVGRPLLVLGRKTHAVNEVLAGRAGCALVEPEDRDSLVALLRADDRRLSAREPAELPEGRAEEFRIERQMAPLCEWLAELARGSGPASPLKEAGTHGR